MLRLASCSLPLPLSPTALLPSFSIVHLPITSIVHPSLRFRRRRRFSSLLSLSICCSLSPSSTSSSGSTCQMEDSLLYSRAYWVGKSLIAWNEDIGDGFCYLLASRDASLSIANNEIKGEDVKIKLEEDRAGLPTHVVEKFPHIRDYKALKLPTSLDVKHLLKCQLAVVIYDSDGKCRNCTGLQLPGVIDELFSYNGPLGAVFSGDAVSLHLWAPTAQAISAYIYAGPTGENPIEIVQLEEDNGVWKTKGPKSWEGCYYVYEVNVYHPSTLRVEKCYANDPYARGLSADARRTFLINLDADELKPEGWDDLANKKPVIRSFSDISIYEMHVRDFSANDFSVKPELRGGYLAFTLQDSAGVLHLKKLSSAGITHLHLLPTFQFAGVDDQKENWRSIDFSILEGLPPDSDQQQTLITAIQDYDGYNWGYNPVLFGVPKGSYASNPNGPYRIVEFRKMVQALNHIGLRVVLDVVYNHLQGRGPFDEHSVLDKIVPGYYLRRDINGAVEQSTCMNNTASEHFMVDRLIIDDLIHWAVNYKVDGFRFDLMGHIMKSTMVRAKNVLHCLTKEKDGTDGSTIYIYGEGWDFGEVAKNGRGVNASQFNLSGTGIGSFNDRIRDAVLGGSPFGHPLQQGFATGLLLQPNGHDHGTEANADLMLGVSRDHIQVGMAANLRDFVLTNSDGKEVKGSEVLQHDGTPVAYASAPTETINYVSAHDNETLFDNVSLKAPMSIPVTERFRINQLATSIIALSQGIPFFHSGDEILRSKSLDRDSYNSGDWFNRLDFSYNSNNWGVGLPPREKNEKNWPLMKPRLGDPSFRPQKSEILATLENFLNLLRIRYSSPLFRLRTENDIQERVRFHNTGPSWVRGVIAMSIEDGQDGVSDLSQLDPMYSYIVVVVNASPNEVSFVSQSLQSRNLLLHPVQVVSSDEVVKRSKYEASSGCFVVPGRTASVFVAPR
ncbi:hypothetical protein K1719_004525 [Acacia pycnantha]|nr:hypothetical protein K1719_004525 [Acacia pycnantha]